MPSGTTRRSFGSSPLARGLLVLPYDTRADERIIPARAGFTGPGARRRRRPADHPRSRGVYAHILVHSRVLAGSSPLARGLHSAVPRQDDADGIIPARAGFTYEFCAASAPGRIIPARAGFTSPRGRPACRVRDHPRSRGVYSTSQAPTTSCRGSSPLARGLRGFSRTGEHSPRIIPARAGFTELRRDRRQCRRDHPRSRGVY